MKRNFYRDPDKYIPVPIASLKKPIKAFSDDLSAYLSRTIPPGDGYAEVTLYGLTEASLDRQEAELKKTVGRKNTNFTIKA